MPTTSPRQRVLARKAALWAERQTWLDHWRELADHIYPRRSRFLSTERNKPKRNDKIINSTPRRAHRILTSGMMAGITSPARPWYRFSPPDPALAELGDVREWLHEAEEIVREAIARSNLYNCLHNVYGDLAGYGTSALHVEEDEDDFIRAYVFPIGQYALSADAKGRIDTVYRELSMTTRQLVEMFGEAACSDNVREQYQRNALDEWHPVLHVVEPNREHVEGATGPAGKPIRSCWLEMNGGEGAGFLREAGYDEMPVLCPRWEATGEDVYGSSPGMDALGDAKELQFLARRKAQLIDKTSTPPMNAPASMANKRGGVGLLPGDTNYADAVAGGQKIEPAIVIQPQAINAVQALETECEQRINSDFYADLFLMIAASSGPNMTAEEVRARMEEKMLQLGPALQRLQDELLDPLIDRVFAILLRRGLIPEPPEALQGVELKVEYISIVEQAQKVLGATGIERLAAFVNGLAATAPETIDKLNFDEVVDSYAAALGVPPALVRSDEKVAALREARAAAAAQQQQNEALTAATQAAGNLAGASLENDNALSRIVQGMGGAVGVA